MCAALIGSDPHSRRSSFQQEVDQNNLACIQFLSDSHHSPLISPGCYFCCCKPVIIQGMKWTEKHVGKKQRKMYFFSENTRRGRGPSTLCDKQGIFSSFQWAGELICQCTYELSLRDTSGLCQKRRDHIYGIKRAFLHSVIHSVHFPPWYVEKEGLPLRSLVRHWYCKVESTLLRMCAFTAQTLKAKAVILFNSRPVLYWAEGRQSRVRSQTGIRLRGCGDIWFIVISIYWYPSFELAAVLCFCTCPPPNSNCPSFHVVFLAFWLLMQ